MPDTISSKWLTALLFILMLTGYSCSYHEKETWSGEMKPVFEYLTDIQIEWEGTEVGFTPILDEESNVEAILKLTNNPIRDLIEALSDKKLFVNAHVLLTRISGIEYELFPTWNGLKVEIASDGTVTINPEQRHNLSRRWKRWYQTEPRPKVLPLAVDYERNQ